jgi:hypothetical protein
MKGIILLTMVLAAGTAHADLPPDLDRYQSELEAKRATLRQHDEQINRESTQLDQEEALLADERALFADYESAVREMESSLHDVIIPMCIVPPPGKQEWCTGSIARIADAIVKRETRRATIARRAEELAGRRADWHADADWGRNEWRSLLAAERELRSEQERRARIAGASVSLPRIPPPRDTWIEDMMSGKRPITNEPAKEPAKEPAAQPVAPAPITTWEPPTRDRSTEPEQTKPEPSRTKPESTKPEPKQSGGKSGGTYGGSGKGPKDTLDRHRNPKF